MYSKKIALNPQHWSIRNKIVGIVALIVLVTTVALAVNNHFSKTDLYQKQTAANLEEYGIQLADRSLGILQRNVENLITLALSPSLIEAVQEANGRYSGLDSDQIDEDIATRDKAWNENDPSSEELVKSILEDQTSLHLRSFQQTFPDEVEVFFTDERGLILGMTERTSDYLQADEEWWKQTYRDGQGSLYVSAVEYDESAKTWAVNVGVPIRSEGDQKIIGVLRGTVDITAMFSGLDDLEEEQGIHTLIVDKDKKVIYSKNPDDLMQEVPDQYSAFIDQGQAGWNINLKDTDGQPIRLAHLRMNGKYADNLDWSLLLYEHQDDVDLMMSQTDRRAMLVSGSILIAMIIAGIMLGTNLTRPFNLMTETARRLATGDVTLSGIDRKKVARNLTRRDEVGEMTRALSELIDYMRILANSAQHIAVGDISVTIQSKGEQDLLGNAFQRMVVYLEEIARVADQLSLGVVNIEIVPQSENDVLRNAFVRMVDYQLEMLSAAKLMAMGDLSLILEPHSEDDAQGNAYVQMIDILRDIVGQVKRGAEHLGISSVELSQVASQASLASAQIAMTVGQVASGINQENDSVNKTVVSVDQMSRAIDSVAKGALEQAQSIENVANAINELTFAIKDINHGAMEQAEQMERANSARGSMSQAIENVVKATEAVGVESDRSAKAARDGAELASTGIVGMERVREATEELANRVFDLGQRSSQIGAIVETIADIASTTNLLALNAAIEAARAGEHGKGFAVVADEVRKLAERSAIATQEISEMIRVIQSGVSNAVETMQKAGKDVRSAVELTNQESRAFETIAAGTQVSAEGIETIHTALQAMQTAEEQLLKAIRDASAVAERNRQASEAMDEMNNQVVAGLESVSAIVEENTAATQVMTSISEEVSQAIEDIAATSEENSASIEEVAAAAEQLNAQIEEVTASAGELSDMARGLQEAVSQFNLGEEEQMLPPESMV